MSKVAKSLYTPLSMSTGIVGALLAGAIFGQVWRRIGDNDPEPPDPKDLEQSLKTVMVAAAAQGLIAGLVRAMLQRAGARTYVAMTNERPPS